jgi:hypothetical protein
MYYKNKDKATKIVEYIYNKRESKNKTIIKKYKKQKQKQK